MDMKQIFAALLLIVFATGPAGAQTYHPDTPDDILRDYPTTVVQLETAAETHSFVVEVALDGPHWQQGLMWRTSMDDDKGMLFVFPQRRQLSFWMKNTYLPLDIIYIDTDGTVVSIADNAKPLDPTSLPSEGHAQAVLEVNAGLAAELDIQPGDRLVHQAFPLRTR